MYSNTDHLINLFISDNSKKSLNFALSALKPGLISKSSEVAMWSSRLFSKIAFEI